ncbi:hypothetical protein POM88_034285 [Heracleum sosnowskyi]|uniref:Uncharacterized protein n=1 Tax=Heracleum sosnowskyi TaxID=360622 RepID=A0AAD8MDG2_9APIA|nr:hypothetical protein POM88_034285 [Heracleum sosnowskyi]
MELMVLMSGVADEALPPPLPPPRPLHADVVVPLRVGGDFKIIANKPLCVPITGHGLSSIGNKVQLLTNHIKVSVTNVDVNFFTTISSSSMKTVVQLFTHFQQFER